VQAQAQRQELKTTLAELERLHAEETLALRTLSRDAIDLLTERKLELWQKLREVTAHVTPQAEDRACLERLKRAALLNQMLIHHARDAVRTILQSTTGQPLVSESSRPHAVQDGLRVDFRG
jgi:hypothetical protein